MATEVLRPQDCLIGSHQQYPRRGISKHARINRKGKVAQAEISPVVKSTPVTILRRGESLDGRSKVGRVGRSMGDVYAGSAFLSTSPPPPSSLPLPSFTAKNTSSEEGVMMVDSASRDLRRLLRLE